MNKISTGGPCETRRRTQVEDQTEILDKAIFRMSELAERLESRIQQVTRDEDCCPSGEGCPEPYLVPMADTLRSFSKRVDGVANRLDGLFLRIEL